MLAVTYMNADAGLDISRQRLPVLLSVTNSVMASDD